jgi:hypothetical protein
LELEILKVPKSRSGYGLLHIPSGELMGVYTRSNQGSDCCCDEQYILSAGADQLWIVEDAVTAAYVRKFSTEWYNANYETPTNDYPPEDLGVVKISIVVETDVSEVDIPEIPTVEEFMERKYRKTDPWHVDCVLKDMKKYPHKKYTYLLYDLKSLLWSEQEKKKGA